VIRSAVRGVNRRYKVMKIVLRIAYVDDRVVERDVVGAINIGLKYLSSGGRPVAFGSMGTHEARTKSMIQSLGATPLVEIQVFEKPSNTVSGKSLHQARRIFNP
jgi:hypothetical protein